MARRDSQSRDATTTPRVGSVVGRRVVALDLLRGLMVALMVLDHTREYFSAQALQFDATDMARTTPWLFATRWVTHLCAPTFVFLAGVSVHLQGVAGKPASAIRRLLVTRGLWLILLEVSVIGFAFNFAEPFLFLQVIWAIGFGMVVLAALCPLPKWAVGTIGVVLVACTPALTVATASFLSAPLWHLLLVPGPLAPAPGVTVYPVLPWLGILLLGFAAGPVLVCPDQELRRRAILAGACLIAAFVLLRMLGVGDVRSGEAAKDPILHLLTYIDVSKYPPSPQYVCLTLGVSSLLLAAMTALPAGRMRTLHAFGSAPFFTYVLHIYVVHGLALVVGMANGVPASAFTHFIEGTEALRSGGWGFGLPAVYAIWFCIILVLRPLAIRFAALKRERSSWWLSYL